MIRLILPVILIGLCALEAKAELDPLKEYRYTTAVKRDKNGDYLRRADVLAAFKRIHACPSTKKNTGACRGWQINHDIPLACGGADAVYNMTWQPVVIKTGWQDWSIDRFERLIYQAPWFIADTATCKNEIVIITDKIQ